MKKKIRVLLLTLVLSVVLCTPALAATETITASGFYNIGSAENVEITPFASDVALMATSADVDNDGEYEILYANSDRLEVTYSVATDEGYYGVALVEGSGLPTKDNTIFFIDQVTAESNEVKFNVYPKLPTKSTDLTLYISSNVDGFKLISIPLNYTIKGTFNSETLYTLGDVNADGKWDSSDALRTLRIAAELHTPTAAERAAANVNGDALINADDALRILRYAAKLITSLN